MPRLPSAELAASLAGYITDRRDKRRITLAVLGAYLAAALYSLLAPGLGLAMNRLALDSLEALAMVVVVAHIAGGVVQRTIAQRAVAQTARRGDAAPAVSPPAAPPAPQPVPRSPAPEAVQ